VKENKKAGKRTQQTPESSGDQKDSGHDSSSEKEVEQEVIEPKGKKPQVISPANCFVAYNH
jgi:hypothetical protein